MSSTLFRFLLPLALAMASAITSAAWAGEYFEGDGVAIRGHDPVAYFKDGKPVKGSAEHRFEHKGSTFHFASKANRDVQKQWSTDIPGHVGKANRQWPAVAKQTKVIE